MRAHYHVEPAAPSFGRALALTVLACCAAMACAAYIAHVAALSA